MEHYEFYCKVEYPDLGVDARLSHLGALRMMQEAACGTPAARVTAPLTWRATAWPGSSVAGRSAWTAVPTGART